MIYHYSHKNLQQSPSKEFPLKKNAFSIPLKSAPPILTEITFAMLQKSNTQTWQKKKKIQTEAAETQRRHSPQITYPRKNRRWNDTRYPYSRADFSCDVNPFVPAKEALTKRNKLNISRILLARDKSESPETLFLPPKMKKAPREKAVGERGRKRAGFVITGDSGRGTGDHWLVKIAEGTQRVQRSYRHCKGRIG